MSSGHFTKEAVITTEDGKEIYESSPEGFTISLKEPEKSNLSNDELNRKLSSLYTKEFTQEEFDFNVAKKFGVNISTSLSLAHTRYLSHKSGFKNQQLYKYISEIYNQKIDNPNLICNILKK